MILHCTLPCKPTYETSKQGITFQSCCAPFLVPPSNGTITEKLMNRNATSKVVLRESEGNVWSVNVQTTDLRARAFCLCTTLVAWFSEMLTRMK